jgi:hypothetical protein
MKDMNKTFTKTLTKTKTMNAQNNTLGLNSTLVSAILTIADNLRGNYQNVGATNYQLPRNPYPMHKLIINALPTSKSKAMTLPEISKAIESSGYRVSKVGYRNHVNEIVGKLFKAGKIQRSGTRHSFRYWFAL